MGLILITGVGGLIGSTAAQRFHDMGLDVVGIDNDMRSHFFGTSASVRSNIESLQRQLPNFRYVDADIRDRERLTGLFRRLGSNTELVLHAAAQPSHDWAARDPFMDYEINATATLSLLELTRSFASDAVFVFMSTNKVYGDRPNSIPVVELDTRWSPTPNSGFAKGIDESMSIDNSLHSLFGASKLSADILVQEFGKYFGMKTVALRAGCLTGPSHSGAQLHGFLSYLVKCAVHGKPYTVYGYKGKQVRDNLHSEDVISAIIELWRNPAEGGLRFNLGGGLSSNTSMLEAIDLIQELCGRELQYSVSTQARKGDHRWYISDTSLFSSQYPNWAPTFSTVSILTEMVSRELEA